MGYILDIINKALDPFLLFRCPAKGLIAAFNSAYVQKYFQLGTEGSPSQSKETGFKKREGFTKKVAVLLDFV